MQSCYVFSASPAHVLKAVRILCCHGYSAVLWPLDSSSASSFFKACNSCVKRVFRLPLNTFTYLVEGHLNAGAPLLRNMVLGRYPTFYQILMRSPSIEVSLMAEMIAMGARITTACNLAYLKSLTSLDCGAACGALWSLTHLKKPHSWCVQLLSKNYIFQNSLTSSFSLFMKIFKLRHSTQHCLAFSQVWMKSCLASGQGWKPNFCFIGTKILTFIYRHFVIECPPEPMRNIKCWHSSREIKWSEVSNRPLGEAQWKIDISARSE